MSFQKRSDAEFASGSSDMSKKDGQSCNPSKEDDKRQSVNPRKKGTSVGPLEGDEEPENTTPGSSVPREGDASSNPLASEKKDERSPTISHSSVDDELDRFPKHDGGQEDAPSGNRISAGDIASGNPIDDERSHARTPPSSNTEGDAPKSIWQHRITSAGGSAAVKTWYCGHCQSGESMTIGLDTHCFNCGLRRDFYSHPPLSFPKSRR